MKVAHFVLLLSSFVSFTFSQAASADAATLLPFFENLEDRWRGEGLSEEFDWDGDTTSSLNFDLELEIEKQGRQESWEFQQQIRREDSTSAYETFYYSVGGDELFVSTFSNSDPVELLYTSEDRLGYRFESVEWWSGRIFKFEIHLSLQNNRLLNGTRTVQVQGHLIERQSFRLKRR